MPFMVMTDGASRDARLLRRTGRESRGEWGGGRNELGRVEEKWKKSMIEKERER